MVERCILIVLLYMSKGVFFVLEQPRGSSMEFHPKFQWLLAKHSIWRISFNMSRSEASLAPLTLRLWRGAENNSEISCRGVRSSKRC